MKIRAYRNEPFRKTRSRQPYFYTAFFVAGIFILLPFTTYLNEFMVKLPPVKDSVPIEPIPPLIDPVDEPDDEPEPQEDLPELVEPPVNLPLTDLLLASLPIGPGGFGGGTLGSLSDLMPTSDQLTFEEHDLDRAPRVIRRGRLDYPHELRRNRIEGTVRLKVIIDERGRVRVAEILDATHREFVQAAIQCAEDSLFESPVKNGKAVRAYFVLPINFSLR